MKDQFKKIFEALAIDCKHAVIRPLCGGRMHEVWQVDNYVVKRLRHADKFEESQSVARKFLASGIPAVVPLDLNQKSVIEIDGELFMVFPFIEGKSITVADITTEEVETVAHLLRRMHQLKLVDPFIKPFELCFVTSDFGSHASPMIDLIIKKYHEYPLPKNVVLSHRDLDFQNILWGQEGLQIIDWDLAGLISPVADLLCTALYWSVVSANRFSFKNFREFLEAYGDIGGLQSHFKGAFYWVLTYWLDWALYNIRLGGAEQACEAAYCIRVIRHLMSIQPDLENIVKEHKPEDTF